MKISIMKYIALLLIINTTVLNAQIAVDGLFSDWENVSTKIEESDNFNGLDILSLSVTNDDENLYVKIETNYAFDLQDEERISVFIDADNNCEYWIFFRWFRIRNCLLLRWQKCLYKLSE